MYQIVTVEDEISVPPTKFNLDLSESVAESLAEKFEGRINPEIGVILAITDIDSVGEGRVLPGDPSVHYPTVFKVLSWMPREHEIVEGEVIDITEFGAFIRAGALDGLVHISQVMDDFVSYDDKNGQLVGRQSKRVLKQGDPVRGRIISISFKEQSKVGLTMRQPFLGSLKWLTEKAKEEKKVKKEEKKAEKEAAKEEKK
jgi:DNA-directed RNA polymerase subunit E'